MTDTNNQIIGSVVDDVRAVAQDRDTVSIRAVVENLGSVSQNGMMLVPALIAATPLSGIPGLTAICGLTITLIAAQMVFGRKQLWLPDWIMRRSVDADDLRSALDKSDRAIRFLDRHTHQRLRFFVRAPGRMLIKVVCLLCGLTMPFLELLPFTGSLMGATVTMLSISLLVRDGLFAVLGLAFLGTTVAVVATLLT